MKNLSNHLTVWLRRIAGASALVALTPACVSHSAATEFHGVAGVRGVPIEYQTTTSYAIHGLFVFPLLGDARKSSVVDAFAEEAAARGASRQRIAQTSSLTYWFILPPISFFVHPVVTSIEGDIELE
jgi:hypothetical protein